MKSLYLKHPTLGICASQLLKSPWTDESTIYFWKHKYGRKFFECVVEKSESISNSVNHEYASCKVVNIKTGDIYDNVIQAAKENNISTGKVYFHCNKKIKTSGTYLFRWDNRNPLKKRSSHSQ